MPEFDNSSLFINPDGLHVFVQAFVSGTGDDSLDNMLVVLERIADRQDAQLKTLLLIEGYLVKFSANSEIYAPVNINRYNAIANSLLNNKTYILYLAQRSKMDTELPTDWLREMLSTSFTFPLKETQ